LFTAQGSVRITQSKYATLQGPIENGCTCYTCSHYSVSYIHHLFKAHELTYYTLASIHNIAFMMRLMERYRTAIMSDQV
jgi:queuine tRNA-ribosyltransferase